MRRERRWVPEHAPMVYLLLVVVSVMFLMAMR
jgi:hypothetical protein